MPGNTRQRNGGGRAYHSVLEPHFDLIRQLRRQRLTWKEIAARLRTDRGLEVTLSGVYRFCRRRARRTPSWEAVSAPTPGPEPTIDHGDRASLSIGEDARPPTTAVSLDSVGVRPMSRRRPALAALPAERDFRRPNLEDLTLNDPLKP